LVDCNYTENGVDHLMIKFSRSWEEDRPSEWIDNMFNTRQRHSHLNLK